jgi:hypothetical protein
MSVYNIRSMRIPSSRRTKEMFRALEVMLLLSMVLTACNKPKPAASAGKTASPSDSGNPEQTVMQMERKQWDLAKRKDKTAAASLMAEDFVDVGESGVVNRTKVLETFGQATINSFTLDQMQAVALAPTVVLVTYKATAQGSAQGHPLPSPTYVSSVWVNRGGHWLNVLYHDTTAAK